MTNPMEIRADATVFMLKVLRTAPCGATRARSKDPRVAQEQRAGLIHPRSRTRSRPRRRASGPAAGRRPRSGRRPGGAGRGWGYGCGAGLLGDAVESGGLRMKSVLAAITDTALQAAGILPGTGERHFEDRHALLALSHPLAFVALGAYVTARLAPTRPVAHALALG